MAWSYHPNTGGDAVVALPVCDAAVTDAEGGCTATAVVVRSGARRDVTAVGGTTAADARGAVERVRAVAAGAMVGTLTEAAASGRPDGRGVAPGSVDAPLSVLCAVARCEGVVGRLPEPDDDTDGASVLSSACATETARGPSRNNPAAAAAAAEATGITLRVIVIVFPPNG